jgi:hypothetical protein
VRAQQLWPNSGECRCSTTLNGTKGDSDEPMKVLVDLTEDMAAADVNVGVEIDSFFVSARRFDNLRKRLGKRLVPAQLVDPCGW